VNNFPEVHTGTGNLVSEIWSITNSKFISGMTDFLIFSSKFQPDLFSIFDDDWEKIVGQLAEIGSRQS
jgi:hypothetical protein